MREGVYRERRVRGDRREGGGDRDIEREREGESGRKREREIEGGRE